MDLNDIMQQMGPIKDAMAQADQKRREARIEGSAGGGAVRVELQGDLQLLGCTIAPAAAAASSDDVGMLEDLILAAVNDALRQYRERFGASPEEQLQKSMGDSGLGSMLGPFL